MMGTYDTPSGHPVSPDDDAIEYEGELRDDVYKLLDDAGMPDELTSQIDKIIETWGYSKAAKADAAADQAMHESWLADQKAV